jgi:hypothetical protein
LKLPVLAGWYDCLHRSSLSNAIPDIAGGSTTRQPKRLSRRAQKRAVERAPSECLFCGQVAKLTGQHVFDDWLRKLGFDGEGIREYIAEPAEPVFERGGPFTKKIKIVCEPCNGIWLSTTIEESAKPILLRLFEARRQISLEVEDQLMLARWAFKIVCVIAQMGTPKTFPLSHCREFRRSDVPPAQVQIWIGTASGMTHPHRGQQLVESRYDPKLANLKIDDRTIKIPYYSARFRLLNVVFDIVGSVPTAGFELRTDLGDNLRQALLPIWPSEYPTIWWPPATNLDVIGGLQGLAAVPVLGIPAIMPPSEHVPE